MSYTVHTSLVVTGRGDHERLEVKWGGSDQDDVSKESERALYPPRLGIPYRKDRSHLVHFEI